MDYFYRWVWEEDGGYTADVTHQHADEFLQQLAYEDRSTADRANHLKSLKMLFTWRQHEHGMDEWQPMITFYSDDGATSSRVRDEWDSLRDSSHTDDW